VFCVCFSYFFLLVTRSKFAGKSGKMNDEQDIKME
jgi:hypothetical protein